MPSLGSLLLLTSRQQPVQASDRSKFRILEEPQLIAALADSAATSGNFAQSWGFWSRDTGPRACKLDRNPQLKATGGSARTKTAISGGTSPTESKKPSDRFKPLVKPYSG